MHSYRMRNGFPVLLAARAQSVDSFGSASGATLPQIQRVRTGQSPASFLQEVRPKAIILTNDMNHRGESKRAACSQETGAFNGNQANHRFMRMRRPKDNPGNKLDSPFG
jgi:hypothetical protein